MRDPEHRWEGHVLACSPRAGIVPALLMVAGLFCLTATFAEPAMSAAEFASAPALPVDGAQLKDPAGNTIVLHGVNHHGFVDVPDGAWDAPGKPLYSGMGHWDPAVVKGTLDDYRKHGFNVVRFHTIVDWWKKNPQSYKDPWQSDEQLDHGMLHRGIPNQTGRVFIDSLSPVSP
jgi:hypothetical protein